MEDIIEDRRNKAEEMIEKINEIPIAEDEKIFLEMLLREYIDKIDTILKKF